MHVHRQAYDTSWYRLHIRTQKKKQGCILTRWGVEADWTRANQSSPAMYLTVLK